MAKTGGLGDQAYVGGFDLSGNILSLDSIHGGPNPLDVTPINASANVRLGGERDGSFEFTTAMDAAAGAEHAALSTLPLTDVVCTYFRGAAVGNPAASVVAKQVNYDGSRGTDGMLTFKVQALANGFGLEWGKQLTPGNFPVTSFLTGDSSTFEGGIANWTQVGNCAVAQTAAQAHSGSKSLQLTSSAGGDMAAAHCTSGSITTQGFAVVPGQAIAAQAWFRTAVSARSCTVGVEWFTAGAATISTSFGSNVTDSAAAWTFASATLTAPATAAFGRIRTKVIATGAGAEVHYVDDVTVTVLPGAVDDLASTSFGAQAYLQVFAFTGTDATIKIQDSADNVTFADVTALGFTQVTSAPFTQRLATAGGATLREFVQVVVVTAAGYTALSFAVMYVRNTTAVVF